MLLRVTQYYIEDLWVGASVLGKPTLKFNFTLEEGGYIYTAEAPKEQLVAAKMEGCARIHLTKSIVYPATWLKRPETEYFFEHRPQFPYGMGNRSNPLVPLRVAAGDVAFNQTGTKVTCPILEAVNIPGWECKPYFYVADAGGWIKGANRFDFFVGDQSIRRLLPKELHNEEWEGTIEPLPKIPAEYNPRDAKCVKSLLEKLGQSLLQFQQSIPDIPILEYGFSTGGATQYHLHQAATGVV